MILLSGISRAVRTTTDGSVGLMRVLVGATRAQFSMSRREIQDFVPIVVNPTATVVLMAVFVYAGREDLATYALVAPMLMGVGTTAVFVASEVMTRERDFQTLEFAIASPAPFPVVLLSRIMVITSISLVGIAESWLIIRFVFGVSLAVHHPWVLAATMFMTAFAAAGTALITAALFCFAQAARTFQNSITFPVYIFSGILVPLAVLPDWLEPLSRGIFLYWSAELLRAAIQPAAPEGVLLGLAVMAALGIGAAFIGGALMVRMINYLKREGRLGIL